MQNIITLTIPAKNEYITVARLCASGIGNIMKFTVDDIEDIKMALAEACTNAIRHGYGNKGDPNDKVFFHFIIQPTKLVIEVKDNGKGFDTKEIEKYIEQSRKKDLKDIGLGLSLMKSLMDRVEYDSGPSGTKVRMVKNKVR